MYLVTGITGKVGGAVARHLMEMGKGVRALVRDEAKAAAWSQKDVELVKGEWEDAGAMEAALDDVEGAYLMMPPSMTPSRDFREAQAVVASYRKALAAKAPARVVALSSIGSEQTSGLGLITSTHLLEEGLKDLPFPVGLVRAGSFYENFLFALGMAGGGVMPSFYAPVERQLPMVATDDIGAEIARLLTTEWSGRRSVELGSPASPSEVAAQLSTVVGQEVKAQAVPRESWTATLEGMGFPKIGIWAYEEMVDGINSGWIHFGVEGTEKVPGTLDAASVFAAAKEKQAN